MQSRFSSGKLVIWHIVLALDWCTVVFMVMTDVGDLLESWTLSNLEPKNSLLG